MKKSVPKWFLMIVFVAIMAFPVIVSTALAEGTGSGNKEGIKVHGHWKIVVMNPDGTVDSITEFDNALAVAPGGASRLVNLMTGSSVHGGWRIQLDGGASQPCDSAGTPTTCIISESGVPYIADTLHSTNLTITSNTASITLSGSVVADYAATITGVSTDYASCLSAGTTIDSCRTTGPSYITEFTITSLGTPPSVVPSQVIQVTVDISFS